MSEAVDVQNMLPALGFIHPSRTGGLVPPDLHSRKITIKGKPCFGQSSTNIATVTLPIMKSCNGCPFPPSRYPLTEIILWRKHDSYRESTRSTRDLIQRTYARLNERAVRELGSDND